MSPSRGKPHRRGQNPQPSIDDHERSGPESKHRSYSSQERGRERRESPTYGDYSASDVRLGARWEEQGHHEGRRGRVWASHSNSQSSQRRSSPVYGDYDGMASTSRGYHTSSTRYGGYSNYQRGPTDTNNDQNTQPPSPRRSASPRPKESALGRTASPPLIFRGTLTPPKAPAPPPPPRRTEPTEEYLAASLQPSTPIEDPTVSRKLIVLDLNGSLLLRSAHPRRLPPHRGAPRPGQPTNGRWDPYADPTQLRPLRTVHSRPYLGVFKAYILHEETKKWLDTMVWSSAQPHSVADMVDKCFQGRKGELKAVWARDTLGLTGDEYHRKTLTLKDLAKPWAELSSLQTLATDRSSPTPDPTTNSNSCPIPNSEDPSRSSLIPSQPPAQQSHSARTTLLIDDSPLKAALQPWNHLCIREYVQEMRRWDLGVADWEVARAKTLEAREAREAAEKEAERRSEAESRNAGPSTSAMAASVEVLGRDSEQVQIAEVEPEGVDEDIAAKPTKKRKLKRHAKKEATKEEKEREALLAMATASGGPTEELEDQDAVCTTEEVLAKLEEKMRYDETLLAVVGVLDRIKHEGNIAGWMRSGGLLHVDLPSKTLAGSEDVDSDTNGREALTLPPQLLSGQGAQSRSESPAPAKRRRVGSEPEPECKEATHAVDVKADARSSSPTPMPPPSSQLTSSADQPSSPTSAPMDDDDATEQASTGVPLASPTEPDVRISETGPAPANASSTTNAQSHTSPSLWYEKPAVMGCWAERGRRALKELEIEIESGIVPVPGGLQK